ncbi:MAG: hypothetical protein ATN36_07030 [Epulopiscium sp. Nele67-Bin005]|nr:MAG: hypothetical protein ATN36_07030 [Epulopiscium sp. Nele67-Bin005]
MITLVVDKGVAYTRVAKIIENKVQNFFVVNHFQEERQDQIYIGQVSDIVKDLKCAFVDFGQDKKGMLNFKLIPEEFRPKLNIGTRLAVQVAKEQSGSKGDRLTSYLNLTGLYCVCLLFEKGVAISKKISDKEEREQLKNLVMEISQNKYGFIVRTDAKDVEPKILEQEILYLMQQADKLIESKDNLSKGTKIELCEINYGHWLLNQNLNNTSIRLLCNNKEETVKIKLYLEQFFPNLELEIVQYNYADQPFKIIDIERIFSETLKYSVWLKNGSNLIIENNEALTVVDVNTAKANFTKNKNISYVNKLAVEETIYQSIKRNLAGIIIIDLIQMNDDQNLEIYQFAKDLILKLDRGRTKVYPITEIGLMQLTRSRQYKPIHEVIFTSTIRDGQRGLCYQLSYICYLLEQKLRPVISNNVHSTFNVQVSNELKMFLNNTHFIEEFEKYYNIKLNISKSDLKDYFKVEYH